MNMNKHSRHYPRASRYSSSKGLDDQDHYRRNIIHGLCCLFFLRLQRIERADEGNMYRGTLFLVMILAGWNDASQGPLLPSLQAYYNVSHLFSVFSAVNHSNIKTGQLFSQ